MNLKWLLKNLDTLARRPVPSVLVDELRALHDDLAELLDDAERRARASGAAKGFDPRTADVANAIRVGLEEMIDAYGVVEHHRERSREITAEARRQAETARIEQTREAIFATAIAQATTTTAGRALATGLMADGTPVGGGNHREALLRELCKLIAANVASYATVDGDDLRASSLAELMDAQGFGGDK